jgi:uncharacterized SAM-binding protein YcdF (DUF218 family)
MHKYLSGAGVPAAKIVMEKNSLTTVHNIQNTKPLIIRGRYTRVYLVTTDFHLQRSLLIFKNLVPRHANEVEGISSPSGLTTEMQAQEEEVEKEMMGRYKTRFPDWNFEI